jgi:hypothetical protein
MVIKEKEAVLQRLNNARAEIEELLPKIDPSKEIYPRWTIHQMLAHMTGWDDASIDSLRAHIAGNIPATPADRGIDEYNARTVTSRQDLDLEHILKECQKTRQMLKKIIEDMPENKFVEPLIVPWGEKGTVKDLIEVFIEHEEEHARDIRKWLQNPDKPLGKEGN